MTDWDNPFLPDHSKYTVQKIVLVVLLVVQKQKKTSKLKELGIIKKKWRALSSALHSLRCGCSVPGLTRFTTNACEGTRRERSLSNFP